MKLAASCLVLLLLSNGASNGATESGEARAREAEAKYRCFSVPIEAVGLPAEAKALPVSTPIDFQALVDELQASGVVDERSLRLFRLEEDGRGVEQPVQFSPLPQARLKGGRLLPGTSKQVSYPGEYPAGQTPPGSRVAGQLTWQVDATARGNVRYRLEFGIVRTGSVVQVPYPPQDFRVFDEENRAMPVRRFPRLQIRPQQRLDGAVNILDGKELVTAYHTGPTLSEVRSGFFSFRRPFLYPVNGLEGISLTELGKPHDSTGSHAHHYSLWIAHADVDGHDFWSERGGLIMHEQFEDLEDGPVFCRLIQKIRWTMNTTNLLQERRQLTFYPAAKHFRLIDLELELTPAGAQPVRFGKTTFGFVAARVAQSMSVFDGGGEILNANGDRNEQGAHLKRADWLDQSGPIAPDQWAGLTLLDHPDNLNHPTGWHCRNDGWAGAAFNMDQPFTLKPGAKLHLRYRIVLHSGDAHSADIAQRYREFAAQPVIQIGKPKERNP